jgi:hypothetical protein
MRISSIQATKPDSRLSRVVCRQQPSSPESVLNTIRSCVSGARSRYPGAACPGLFATSCSGLLPVPPLAWRCPGGAVVMNPAIRGMSVPARVLRPPENPGICSSRRMRGHGSLPRGAGFLHPCSPILLADDHHSLRGIFSRWFTARALMRKSARRYAGSGSFPGVVLLRRTAKGIRPDPSLPRLCWPPNITAG